MGNVSEMNMFKLMRVFAVIAVKNVSPYTPYNHTYLCLTVQNV